MTIDPLASLLVGAFGAALLTVCGGLFGAWLQSRREHSRWLRDQRASGYVEYLIAAQRVEAAPGATADDLVRTGELVEALDSATVRLRLLGPDTVLAKALSHGKSLMALHQSFVQVRIAALDAERAKLLDDGSASELQTHADFLDQECDKLRDPVRSSRRALVEAARAALDIKTPRQVKSE